MPKNSSNGSQNKKQTKAQPADPPPRRIGDPEDPEYLKKYAKWEALGPARQNQLMLEYLDMEPENGTLEDYFRWLSQKTGIPVDEIPGIVTK